MASKRISSTPCPACSGSVEISRPLFCADLRCPRCGVALGVSPLYGRVVVLLGILLGAVPAWEVGIHSARCCLLVMGSVFVLLWIPIGFLVLTVVVRVAPFLVKPTLVLRQRHRLTTLDLTPGPKDGPDS
jgi:hypothetical protein